MEESRQGEEGCEGLQWHTLGPSGAGRVPGWRRGRRSNSSGAPPLPALCQTPGASPGGQPMCLSARTPPRPLWRAPQAWHQQPCVGAPWSPQAGGSREPRDRTCTPGSQVVSPDFQKLGCELREKEETGKRRQGPDFPQRFREREPGALGC